MIARMSGPLDLPSQSEVENALLRLLSQRQRPIETQYAYRELADKFKLSQGQRHGSTGTAKGSAWEYLVRQAKRRHKDERLLRCPQTGLWILTAKGQIRATSLEDLDSLTIEILGL